MKKISKGYYIASALLVVWAAFDFYHYFATCKNWVAPYPGDSILPELVRSPLVHGLGKVLLGAGVLAAGLLRSKAKKQLTSLTAVTLLLALGAFAIWGVGMYCMTSVAAEYAASRYAAAYAGFASTIADRNLRYDRDQAYDLRYENYSANRVWQAMDDGGQANSFSTFAPTGTGNAGFLPRLDRDMAYSASALFDSSGQMLACSWEDYFYFEYMTESQWLNREERSHNNARALFDREKLTEAGKEMVSDNTLALDAAALRFTGAFDGMEFTPHKIESVDHEVFQEALHSKGSGPYTVSGVVQDSGLEWVSIYEDPSAAPQNGAPVTFYSDWFDVCYSPVSPPFSFKGQEYPSAAALVAKLGPQLSAGGQSTASHEKGSFLLPSVNYCFSVNGQREFSSHYYGADSFEDAQAELHFYTVSVVYCSPWLTAFGELRNVYLFTFLLAVALVLVARAIINEHLIRPVRAAGKGMEQGEKAVSFPPTPGPVWYETQLLQNGSEAYNERLRMQKNENSRLHSALERARAAEAGCRQMTSAMAQEWKSLQTAIRRQAAGLKTQTPEERSKAVDAILAEVERTDSAVQPILDLSALESGEAKLSCDDFSMPSLIQSVFEKLDGAAREKKLQITHFLPSECTVTADEKRIAQAVSIFAAKAIECAPVGGHLLVKIQKGRSGVSCCLECGCEPLPASPPGIWSAGCQAGDTPSGCTGLELTFARKIIELHGGECSVRSTETGVVFCFTLAQP